jgi:hypothetical protein
MGLTRLNRHGVHIKDVSDYLKTRPKYVPDDITLHEFGKFLKEGRINATDSDPMILLLTNVISKDVYNAAMYIARYIRRETLLLEEEVNALIFNLLRSAVGGQKD